MKTAAIVSSGERNAFIAHLVRHWTIAEVLINVKTQISARLHQTNSVCTDHLISLDRKHSELKTPTGLL